MRKLILIGSLVLSAYTWAVDYKNEIIFYQEFSPLKNEQEIAKFA